MSLYPVNNGSQGSKYKFVRDDSCSEVSIYDTFRQMQDQYQWSVFSTSRQPAGAPHGVLISHAEIEVELIAVQPSNDLP